MSDPNALKRILDDLAAGAIDTARAADLIAGLEHPNPEPVVDAESLYDAPPQRVRAATATPQDAEPGTPESDEEDRTDENEPADENRSADQGAPADGNEPGDEDENTLPPLFTIEMDDIAATAGGFVRDAGDFARHAFERIGNLASSVRQAAPEPPAAGEPGTEAPAPDPQGPRWTQNTRGIERVVLRSVGRRVRLIGDASVATITVEGPHTLRRRGSDLEVSTEGEIGVDLSSFSVIRPPRTLDDLRAIGLGQELVVRVNPAIVVDAEVTGSRLITIGVPHLGKIRVSAGSANLNGVTEVTDALVQAGGATLTGPISEGRSRVRVESGNLTVRLAAGANVTIRSETQLGRVSWPGEPHGTVDEYVVGTGAAALEIGVVMGRAVVRIED
ncbi:hypothetical protein GCM10009785_16770 [Brooklawnia cerclae]|uniref:Ribosomal protein L12E/L44/L45/RPP1/RPP2 n=1 Tax=Brooklawnia cerclae TaxID=349934 RepID=A0ABX0SH81_9ACTN|nr:hypothetical protein [Brooklawnia cerclae]NIH57753.1 ribosomal protein L12E/L44/L45/RPP1/RPP2 [Brooklawnia cerclae]